MRTEQTKPVLYELEGRFHEKFGALPTPLRGQSDADLKRLMEQSLKDSKVAPELLVVPKGLRMRVN